MLAASLKIDNIIFRGQKHVKIASTHTHMYLTIKHKKTNLTLQSKFSFRILKK